LALWNTLFTTNTDSLKLGTVAVACMYYVISNYVIAYSVKHSLFTVKKYSVIYTPTKTSYDAVMFVHKDNIKSIK